MTVVNECIVFMINHIDLMVGNAKEYHLGGWIRRKSSGNFAILTDDISIIVKAATKCIEIIDGRNMLK